MNWSKNDISNGKASVPPIDRSSTRNPNLFYPNSYEPQHNNSPVITPNKKDDHKGYEYMHNEEEYEGEGHVVNINAYSNHVDDLTNDVINMEEDDG